MYNSLCHCTMYRWLSQICSCWRPIFQSWYLSRFVPMVAVGGCYFSHDIQADSYQWQHMEGVILVRVSEQIRTYMVADGGCYFSHGIQTNSYLWQQLEAAFLVMVSKQIRTYGSRWRLFFQSWYPNRFIPMVAEGGCYFSQGIRAFFFFLGLLGLLHPLGILIHYFRCGRCIRNPTPGRMRYALGWIDFKTRT